MRMKKHGLPYPEAKHNYFPLWFGNAVGCTVPKVWAARNFLICPLDSFRFSVRRIALARLRPLSKSLPIANSNSMASWNTPMHSFRLTNRFLIRSMMQSMLTIASELHQISVIVFLERKYDLPKTVPEIIHKHKQKCMRKMSSNFFGDAGFISDICCIQCCQMRWHRMSMCISFEIYWPTGGAGFFSALNVSISQR